MDRVVEAAGRIRRLEVQGATNVAVTAVRALTDELLASGSVDRGTIEEIVTRGIEILVASRETEPMMRNGLRYIASRLREHEWGSVEEFREMTRQVSDEVLSEFRRARDLIVEIGARRVRPGSVILTHCHSSAVSAVLRRAKENDVEFKVIQTETRPKYQGRITARELTEAGIDTTMIVDSAARSVMKEVDFVVVGSDAITSEGNVINKIGTSQVALAAMEARIPFYVISTLLKFDPITIHGEFETIEERSPDEIWPDPPRGLRIRNPAFDVTRRDYIHGIITEEGVISPHSILEAVRRRYPWILD